MDVENENYMNLLQPEKFPPLETFSIAFLRGTANVKLQFRFDVFRQSCDILAKRFFFKTCSGILGNKHGGSKKVLFILFYFLYL